MTTSHLPRRPLGRSGHQVTPIGLGGAYLGLTRSNGQATIDDSLGIATVLRALELGVNLIDTSAGYMGGSRSEEIIGKALQQWLRNGGRRGDLVISTKTGTRDRRHRSAHSYSGEATWESVRTSLALLQTDYLDLVLVHDPDDLEPVLAPGGAWEALKEMRAQGLVRAIGLGVREHAFHQRMIATGDCDVCLTHCDYNLVSRTAADGVLAPAAAHGVGVLNGTSLFHGLLLGEQRPSEVAGAWSRPLSLEWQADLRRAEALYDFAQSAGISLLALNLQYILREPRIAATLMGAATPEQIEADVAALQTPIPDDVWEAMDGARDE
jgi:aryl-alcohol dehydrogenase-like predicted oxidoreductase